MDQDIELGVSLVDGQAELVQPGTIDQVQGNQGRRFAGERADIVVERLKPPLGAGGGDHMGAGASQGQGRRPADASCGARDERNAAGEWLQVRAGHKVPLRQVRLSIVAPLVPANIGQNPPPLTGEAFLGQAQT